MTDPNHQNTKLWGKIKLQRLPSNVSLKTMKQTVRPILIDEPILPSILNIENSNTNEKGVKNAPQFRSKTSKVTENNGFEQLQPSIDSYIINTIKLNQILNSNVPFERVDFFVKSKSCEQISSKRKQAPKAARVNTDEEARHFLKQFVIIMCLHCGFDGI